MKEPLGSVEPNLEWMYVRLAFENLDLNGLAIFRRVLSCHQLFKVHQSHMRKCVARMNLNLHHGLKVRLSGTRINITKNKNRIACDR